VPRYDNSFSVTRLESWFKANLKPEQYQMYLDRLSGVPSEIMEKLVTQFIDERRPTPGFMPTIVELRNAFWRYQQDHPHKYQKRDRTWCTECAGEGILPIRTRAGENFVFCGECENFRRHIGDNPANHALKSHGRYNRQQIREAGWTPRFALPAADGWKVSKNKMEGLVS